MCTRIVSSALKEFKTSRVDTELTMSAVSLACRARYVAKYFVQRRYLAAKRHQMTPWRPQIRGITRVCSERHFVLETPATLYVGNPLVRWPGSDTLRPRSRVVLWFPA